jgi:tryptophan halogenase
MSLGLASGFIEPLEATSIWSVIESLRLLHTNIPGLLNRNDYYIEEFNKNIFRFNNEVVSFIYYHYITDKTNTKYWSEFRKSNIPPAGYLEFENKFKNIFIVNPDLIDSFHRFPASSFISVGVGINFFNRQAVEEQYNACISTHAGENLEKGLQYRLKETNTIAEQTIDHYYLIESIKNEG